MGAAFRQLGAAQGNGAKSMERLSSGFRINKAGDDAAGLSISEKMRGQIRGLNQASRNAQDGISMIQTAEGALNETHSILQRMRELAVQSSSDTNVDELDREAIQNEFTQLKAEIDRIGNTTEFNTQKLIDGSVGARKASGLNNAAIIGSEVGKRTAAKVEGGSFSVGAAALDNLTTNNNTIYVDGAKIEFALDADRLAEYKSAAGDGEKVAALMKEDINNAIAEYNTKNETNIANVDVSFSGGKFSITSGTTGETSSIKMDNPGDANDLFSITKVLAHDANPAGLEATGTEGLFSAAGAASVAAITDGMTVTQTLTFGHATPASAFDKEITFDIGAANADYSEDITIKFAAAASVGTPAGSNAGAAWDSDSKVLTIILEQGQTYDDNAITNLIQGSITHADAPDGLDYTAMSVTFDGNLAPIAGTLAPTGELKVSGGVEKSNVTIDGTEIKVNWANVGASNPETDDPMTAVAEAIQRDINNAIADYNKTVDADKKLEDVKVTVKDGSFQVQSGSTENTSSIKFDNSETAQLLGLAKQSSSTQGGGVNFQIGANQGQTMRVNIEDMRADALGISNIDLGSGEGAREAITTINDAINKVSNQRSELGAFQNRLEHTISNLDNSAENLQAAESRIRDVDMAAEMMEMTKNNILQQASQAMLAQAQNAPQSVLQLLG